MRHWLRSYWLLLQWQVLRLRRDLPFMFIIQTLIAAGVVVGFSFLVPQVDAQSALYLTTGAMTVAMISVGMVIAPQILSQQKLQGVFDYLRTMPVPRLAMLAADATVWVAMALPGLAVTLGVATLRFQLSFSMSPLILPAVLLVATATVGVGYAIAYALRPALVGVATNATMIVALMFAPVTYPAERLPEWASSIHQWLPFQYMAQAVRETVDVPVGGVPVFAFGVLVLWSVVGLSITSRVMTRRT